MMAEFALKCCRVCGSDINIDAETCPLCSSRQHPKKPCSLTVIIVFALLGFLCITLLGIMSAHAIQQAISSRTDFSNEIAIQNVSLAKIAVDNYVAHYGRIPVNLDNITFQADDDVMIILQNTSAKSYRLISSHEQGDKEYLVFSGKNTMYCQKKGTPGLLLHSD
jgi:hypothetical protein